MKSGFRKATEGSKVLHFRKSEEVFADPGQQKTKKKECKETRITVDAISRDIFI